MDENDKSVWFSPQLSEEIINNKDILNKLDVFVTGKFLLNIEKTNPPN